MTEKRSIEPKSNSAVQKFNENFELKEPLCDTAKKILTILGADGIAQEAVTIVGTVKSNVHHWKEAFLKAGALRLECDGVIKKYRLTPYGSKLLTGSDGRVRVPVLLEDRPVRLRVLRREQLRLDWRPLGVPRNWVKLGVVLGEVRVVLNDRLGPNHDCAAVIIHPGQVKGFSSDEVFAESVRVVERVRLVLESKFGMVFDGDGEVVGTPYYRVYRPECRDWIEAGCVGVDGVGMLDASGTHDKRDPLSGQPHLEYKDGKLADVAAEFPVSRGVGLGEAAVEFPLVLRRLLKETGELHQEGVDLRKMITELSSQIVDVVASTKNIVESMQSLLALAKGEQNQAQKSDDKLGEVQKYVS